MDGATCHSATCFQCAFVGVQTGERRQNGRMNVDQAVFIMFAELRSQNAHEARQYDQIGLIGIDFLHHGLIKCQTRVEVFMVQTVSGNTALCRPC